MEQVQYLIIVSVENAWDFNLVILFLVVIIELGRLESKVVDIAHFGTVFSGDGFVIAALRLVLLSIVMRDYIGFFPVENVELDFAEVVEVFLLDVAVDHLLEGLAVLEDDFGLFGVLGVLVILHGILVQLKHLLINIIISFKCSILQQILEVLVLQLRCIGRQLLYQSVQVDRQVELVLNDAQKFILVD